MILFVNVYFLSSGSTFSIAYFLQSVSVFSLVFFTMRYESQYSAHFPSLLLGI